MEQMPIHSVGVFVHPAHCVVASGSGTATRHDLVAPGGNSAFEGSPPFSVVTMLTSGDMLRSAAPPVNAVALFIGCGVILVCGTLTGLLTSGVGVVFWYLLHVGAAAVARRCCENERPPSRVAMLYDRVLGLSGTHFVPKTLAIQAFTVVSQASTKLSKMGAAAWMEDSAWSEGYAFAVLLRPLFWIFFAALVINAVYPAVLLRQRSHALQRSAAATVDVAIDVVYVLTFFFSPFLGVIAVPTLLPTNPVDFFTALWPLAHIFTAAQTIEACAKRRASAPRAARRRNRRYSTSVTDARLGARKAAGFVVASLGSVLLILLTQCRDRYPLGDWHHACRPCVCDGDGALLNCDVPGDIDVWALE